MCDLFSCSFAGFIGILDVNMPLVQCTVAQFEWWWIKEES